VVEDSAVIRDFLTHILGLVPDFQVVGVAHNGEQAISMVAECHPDVITMDIHMPGMNGFEATRRIMESLATPIVIVSGSSTVLESVTACRALGAGALAVEARPHGFGHPEFVRSSEKLVETIRLMAGVKVVRRWPQSHPAAIPVPPLTPVSAWSAIRLAAIGASTGGPSAIVTILAALPKDLPFPVVIVQHICDGFTAGFGEWLAQTSGLRVHIATDGEVLLPGHVYVAPSGTHLGVTSANRTLLSADPLENGVRPSVSYLFRSVASSFGKNAVAILLTGMGTDGAEALKLIRDRGGVTIAQDQASSVVHGMPGAAIRLGAASHILSPESIGQFLRQLGAK
jgi:two-component system chemotaxis response regulator CheB